MKPLFWQGRQDLVNTWKNVTNYKYGLTNPDDPEKQSHIIAKDLPRDKKTIWVLEITIDKHHRGKIQTRQDVIKHIESLGLEVARLLPKLSALKTQTAKKIYDWNEMYGRRF